MKVFHDFLFIDVAYSSCLWSKGKSEKEIWREIEERGSRCSSAFLYPVLFLRKKNEERGELKIATEKTGNREELHKNEKTY